MYTVHISRCYTSTIAGTNWILKKQFMRKCTNLFITGITLHLFKNSLLNIIFFSRPLSFVRTSSSLTPFYVFPQPFWHSRAQKIPRAMYVNMYSNVCTYCSLCSVGVNTLYSLHFSGEGGGGVWEIFLSGFISYFHAFTFSSYAVKRFD